MNATSASRHRTWAAPLAVGALVSAALAVVAVSDATVGSGGTVTPEASAGMTRARVESHPLSQPTSCDGHFVARSLDHTTTTDDVPARQFDSNGTGVAIADLDGDRRPDIVLANLDGPNTILWNEGDWTFTTERMADRGSRAVQLVDVDADGLVDIVTTHRGSGVRWFRNLGARSFAAAGLPGVGTAAYSMAWADFDGDGDLDLATGSYDAELDQTLRSGFLFGAGAGVVVYTNEGSRFSGEVLSQSSQALTTTWVDLDRDGASELIVGHDFAMEDQVWRFSDDTWNPIAPFEVTAAHPMSFDGGDIDGDGVEEYFITDMKPMSTATDVIAAWLPLMASLQSLDRPDQTQRIRNVLLVPRSDGTFDERADDAGIDAAGWAWSATFGDFDNDADLDLYVVNGMIAPETLSYLDGGEIVEANVAFQNDGLGRFAVADQWNLGDEASGRGSALADLDGDGRLDIVVNNLGEPAVAFENRICGGNAVEVTLSMPGTSNPSAIGARVTLRTGAATMVRYRRSGSGYLSGGMETLHFGIGSTSHEGTLEVRWPDGFTTVIDVEPTRSYEVIRE